MGCIASPYFTATQVPTTWKWSR